MLVVDEEQRFGVKHKEKIKRFRASVDVLTLSATPIPRTLHMSLMGIRDLSLVNTPPADRRAVRTRLLPANDYIIQEAVSREIRRGGQVYIVHNRIDTIYKYEEKFYINDDSIGHVFTVWLKFNGGKGVATYVGILFAINIYFGIIFALSWFIIFAITKFSSLSSLIASVSIPVSYTHLTLPTIYSV